MRSLLTVAVLSAVTLLGPAQSHADFVFTSQPVNGHVVQFWLGVNPTAGGGAMQVDMSNPNRPAVSVQGTTGEHVLRFGVAIDGQPARPGRVYIEDTPPGYMNSLGSGNPGGYWGHFASGHDIAELLLRGTTSPGGQLVDAGGHHTYSYPHSQPGFAAAGYALFSTTGTGVTFSLDVVLIDTRGPSSGGRYPQYGPLTWNAPEEVTPISMLPHLPEPTSLGLFGLGLLLGVPLWVKKSRPRVTPGPA